MTLPVGGTLVPMLFTSDATYLTNFSGDGKVWPLYMSIENIKSSVRNRPTFHTWVPVALLPSSPKRIKKVPGWSEEKQEQEAIQVHHDLLRFLLSLLSSAAQNRLKIKCADEVTRECYFRVAGWLVDHLENSILHGIYATRCPICESPQDKLSCLQEYPLHNAQRYQFWIDGSDKESLHNKGVKLVQNALWSLQDTVPHQLIQSDILHTMLLANLQHLMDWITRFLEYHNRLPAFDDVWSSLPHYPGIHMPHKSYRLLSQLFGKEMRSIPMVILRVFTAGLRRKTGTQRLTSGQEQEFKKAITCVRYLTDFALLSRYRSHTDSTIRYMRQYLE